MLIFVASGGRCGTLFFSEMFRALTDYPSLHEPLPWCIGRTLEQINDVEPCAYDPRVAKELDDKIEQIKTTTVDGRYFESSQMFIKSYAPRILDEFRNVGCIYVWRNPIEVLMSHHKKCSEQEIDWILQSHWSKNMLRTAHALSFYDNILWQSLEIKERFLNLRPHFAKTYIFDFSRINDQNEWTRLFEHFGIERKEKTKEMMRRLSKNETGAVTAEDYDAMFKVWHKRGTREEKKYQAKFAELTAIDAGQKLIAMNDARMNHVREF